MSWLEHDTDSIGPCRGPLGFEPPAVIASTGAENHGGEMIWLFDGGGVEWSKSSAEKKNMSNFRPSPPSFDHGSFALFRRPEIRGGAPFPVWSDAVCPSLYINNEQSSNKLDLESAYKMSAHMAERSAERAGAAGKKGRDSSRRQKAASDAVYFAASAASFAQIGKLLAEQSLERGEPVSLKDYVFSEGLELAAAKSGKALGQFVAKADAGGLGAELAEALRTAETYVGYGQGARFLSACKTYHETLASFRALNSTIRKSAPSRSSVRI